MRRLIIPLFVIVFFSSCNAVYYNGHLYKPLYKRSFTKKNNTIQLKAAPLKSADPLVQSEINDTVINFNESSIDSLKAKINRHEIKYNDRYIYTREEVGVLRATSKNKVVGYVRKAKIKNLRYFIYGTIILYAITAVLMGIFASLMLIFLLLRVDNN